MASSGDIVIRQAQAADLADLTALLQVLFGMEEDFSFDEARQRQGLMLMLENEQGVVLAAENSGKVVGMSTGQLLISTAEGGPAVLVEDVVVLPAWQDRGVGRLLMRAIAEWAASKNAVRLQLLADRNNKAALSFYDKIGWQMTDLICLRKT
ncbi:putative acetyltransferase [bacterium BMS3Bbin14]|nr:putative acetyltransferase [bacterium BMS3Abin13]GBE53198.1 putative acetyltransferase [bacterium BMS3Bbin14]HDO30015.1 GNAT family N-acetyltransferase [Desulfobacteraceae bacterium]